MLTMHTGIAVGQHKMKEREKEKEGKKGKKEQR